MAERRPDELRILLVEDNPHDVYFLQHNLNQDKRLTSELVVCTTLKDALQTLNEDSDFDLVLTDLNLPDGLGLNSFERLRKASADLPMIVLTSLADREIASTAMSMGAQEVISKEDLNSRPISHMITNSIERHRIKRRLETAEAHARRQSQFKTDFLAQFSHEIRTPLNGVIGMTSLLLETNLDSEQRDIAETLQRSGETLLCLINDILDLSKIEAGKLEIVPRDFNIRDTIEDVVELHSGTALRKSLLIGCTIHPAVPAIVYGDAARIRQVLSNLIGNAVKFTERGSIIVNLDANITHEDLVLRFRIQDTGRGIPSEKLSQLFRPFSQASVTDNEALKGTGLGLAICKNLVELMDGTIELKSIEGRGSIFSFGLKMPSRPQIITPRPSFAGLTAHVVTDDPDFLEIVSTQLGLRGANVKHSYPTIPPSPLPPNSPDFQWLLVLDVVRRTTSDIESMLKKISQTSCSREQILLITAPQLPLSRTIRNRIGARMSYPLVQSELYRQIHRMISKEDRDENTPTNLMGAMTELNLDFRSGLHALVADDSPVNLKVAEKTLRRLGCDVTVAHDGLEACEIAAKGNFDVILMDYKMPRLDGIEATRRIRTSPGPNQQTLIAALTANAYAEDRQICLAAGMNDFLAKPISINDLRQFLHRHFGKKMNTHPDDLQQLASGGHTPESDGLDQRTLNDLKSLNDPTEARPFLDDLIETYLQGTPSVIDELEGAIHRREARQIESLSHKLKGMSRNLGARLVGDLAEEIENRAAAMDLATGQVKIQEVRNAFEKCAAALTQTWMSRNAARAFDLRHGSGKMVL
jgi:signal transduction histidine kinase/HPt (histidine-containing phosphotransfer) domain-containing protein